jgi:hypothetical protein
MAITTPTIVNEVPFARSGPFSFNNDEDDANAAAVACVAAPGAGKAIYLTHVTISGRLADIAITLRNGDTTVMFGPIQMQADGGGNYKKDWKYPLKLTDNTALYVYASAASAFTLYGEYFIGQAPI